MAGYMTRLNGHVYDFQHKSGVDKLENGNVDKLENGKFVEIDANGAVILTTAAKDTTMKVVEKTTLWRMPAVILDVTAVGTNEVFLCENEWNVYEDAGEYNTAEYAVNKGDFVRMHRPTIGERLIVTVDDTTYAALSVGDTVTPAADGAIAK